MQVDLAQAIALIKRGEVVAIPTETVYGLAADARNEDALKQIYAIKQRPANNPLIVHLASREHVLDWAAEFSPLAQKLAAAFWPGPLTIVLPAKDAVSSIVRAGEPTIALRVPAHPIAQQVLQQTGLGLAAPSANKYTQLSPTTTQHVANGLGSAVPVLEGGACDVGIESTIVAVDGGQWRLLRLGMIAEAQITSVVGVQAALPTLQDDRSLPKAPGQHLLHYSPKTPVQLFTSRAALLQASEKSDCAVLLLGEGQAANGKTFNLPNDPVGFAEQLYGALHQMDALAVATLLIEAPPQQPEWLAIHDRLTRASHKLN
ncbi:MAG: L-threonylcarbamoyladenylate synthase [Methylophilaceae bacterium]|jgi:L-threonylcarbamoyladenylate synthase